MCFIEITQLQLLNQVVDILSNADMKIVHVINLDCILT